MLPRTLTATAVATGDGARAPLPTLMWASSLCARHRPSPSLATAAAPPGSAPGPAHTARSVSPPKPGLPEGQSGPGWLPCTPRHSQACVLWMLPVCRWPKTKQTVPPPGNALGWREIQAAGFPRGHLLCQSYGWNESSRERVLEGRGPGLGQATLDQRQENPRGRDGHGPTQGRRVLMAWWAQGICTIPRVF